MSAGTDWTNTTPSQMFGHVLRPDEMLTRVSYDFAAPAADLSAWVERYWSTRWQMAPGEHHPIGLLDDPSINLTIERGGVFREGTSGEGVWLTGPVTRGRFDVVLSGAGTTVGVKFHVGGTRAFADADLAALRDRTVPAAQWFTAGTWSLLHDLPHSASAAKNALDDFLRAAGPRTPAGYDQFRQLYDLAEHGRMTRLDQLAEAAGEHPRTVQRMFTRFAGVSPKRVLARARVSAAIAAIDRDGTRSLGELAHDLGWFDQAHFIRDFRAITGETPSSYAASPRTSRARALRRAGG